MKIFLVLAMTVVLACGCVFGIGCIKYDGAKGFKNHIVQEFDDIFSKDKDNEQDGAEDSVVNTQPATSVAQ